MTSASLQESTSSIFTGSVCSNWQDKFACRALHRRGRIFSYRKRKTRLADGVFSAPDGVCPHRVTSSINPCNVGASIHLPSFFVRSSQLTCNFPRSLEKSPVVAQCTYMYQSILPMSGPILYQLLPTTANILLIGIAGPFYAHSTITGKLICVSG